MTKQTTHTSNFSSINTSGDALGTSSRSALPKKRIATFRAHIADVSSPLYRDLPWRNTRDPYAILVSEVMLQQTQVSRVLQKWTRFMEHYPTLDALAASPTNEVLEQWQGLGYNRRALALKRSAEICSAQGGVLPIDSAELLALPGIGPATCAGIRAFAHNLPGVYLETNVRTVFLHEFFPETAGVSDKELIPFIEATCPHANTADNDRKAAICSNPRDWYYALLDYGAHLKAIMPNPSRASKEYKTQSRFEGSRRQKRAFLLREVLGEPGISTFAAHERLCAFENNNKRPTPDLATTEEILEELASEGFFSSEEDHWHA